LSREKIPHQIRQQVRERANFLCEYCQTAEQWQYVRFTVDHVIPASSGGNIEPGNLALACFHCNRKKSDATEAKDPQTGRMAALFNPRTDEWNKHFAWSTDGTRIIPITASGRATTGLLEFNRPRILDIRHADLAIGRHPPEGDARRK